MVLACGHRWHELLVQSLKEIAKREGVDNSYVSRMVNLTTLAPDIVTAILDETMPENVVLSDLAIDTPLSWEEQRQRVIEAANKVRGGGK